MGALGILIRFFKFFPQGSFVGTMRLLKFCLITAKLTAQFLDKLFFNRIFIFKNSKYIPFMIRMPKLPNRTLFLIGCHYNLWLKRNSVNFVNVLSRLNLKMKNRMHMMFYLRKMLQRKKSGMMIRIIVFSIYISYLFPRSITDDALRIMRRQQGPKPERLASG